MNVANDLIETLNISRKINFDEEIDPNIMLLESLTVFLIKVIDSLESDVLNKRQILDHCLYFLNKSVIQLFEVKKSYIKNYTDKD